MLPAMTDIVHEALLSQRCLQIDVRRALQDSRAKRLRKKSSPEALFRSLQHGEQKPLIFNPSNLELQVPQPRHKRTVGFALSPHAESPQAASTNGDIASHAVPVSSDLENSDSDVEAWVPSSR